MAVKTLPQIKPSPAIEDSQGSLSHLYCLCDDTVSLCGWDLTNADEEWDEESVCVVCEELDLSETYVCPQCGF